MSGEWPEKNTEILSRFARMESGEKKKRKERGGEGVTDGTEFNEEYEKH